MSDVSSAPEVHAFDRRRSDVNVESLAIQVRGLAGRVEVLEEQGRTSGKALTDNTTLTREVHDAVFGVEGEFAGLANMTRDVHTAVFGENGSGGVQQVVSDIRDVVQMGRGVFRFAQRMSNGTGKTADFLSRTIKRFWPIAALVIAAYTYLRTGKWEWPTLVP